jgi:hypothetical protein
MIDYALLRPWLVSLPPRELTPCEVAVWELEAPRDTPSLRKLSLEVVGSYLAVVRQVNVGGRDLLPEGGFLVRLFGHDKPETFDVRIERGTPIRVTVENISASEIYALGYLLGMKESAEESTLVRQTKEHSEQMIRLMRGSTRT